MQIFRPRRPKNVTYPWSVPPWVTCPQAEPSSATKRGGYGQSETPYVVIVFVTLRHCAVVILVPLPAHSLAMHWLKSVLSTDGTLVETLDPQDWINRQNRIVEFWHSSVTLSVVQVVIPGTHTIVVAASDL